MKQKMEGPIAEILSPLLRGLRQVRSSQIKHFQRYMTGLIQPCEKNKKSVTALSEEALNPCCQSSLNRFLNSNRILVQRINNSRIEKLGLSKNSRFLAIDDTILEHPYGPKIQGTGKYWDASKKRWIHGHNIVTSMAVSTTEAEPIDIHVYIKEEDAERNNTVFRTKIEIACEIIRWRAEILNVIGVLFDSWYCCEDVLKICDELELHWHSELRANRLVFLPGISDKFHVSELARALPLDEFKKVDLPDSWQKYKFMAERNVIIRGKKTKARTIKLVILWDGKDNLESYKFLATNNLSATGVEVLEIHRLRWKIEEFHRDAKQNLGMADCMLRKYDGVVIHLLLVLLAYSALKRLLASTLKGIVNTIGDCGRYLKRQILEKRYSNQTAIT